VGVAAFAIIEVVKYVESRFRNAPSSTPPKPLVPVES
jgi:hypothetical protein